MPKRIFTPPSPHDHAGSPPIGGGGLRLIEATLSPEGVLSLQNGSDETTPVGDPLLVDMSGFFDDTQGGASISVQGTLVLPAGEIPTDLNFMNPNFSVINDLDGTVSVDLRSIGTGYLINARRPITLKTAGFNVTDTEEGHALHVNSALAQTVTIRTNTIHPIPVGYEIEILRYGSGNLTITAAAGVMLNGIDGASTTILRRYSGAVLRKIAPNEWVVIGNVAPIGEDTPPDEVLPVYTWADVFKDHTATVLALDGAGEPYTQPGQNWTGWGVAANQPINVPIEFFLQNVIAEEAPNGAILQLFAPGGTMHLQGRLQPPPRSRLKNLTMDFTGQKILRGNSFDPSGSGRWGNMFLWGEKVNDPALPGQATVGANAAIGDTTLVVSNDADGTTLLNTVTPGSIIEIRTNTTSAGYHPPESRTTCFVTGVNIGSRTLTLADPLDIAVPVSNPVGSWESSDPSTITLLQGSLLTANAAAGQNVIVMANAAGLAAGDWLLVRTAELPGPGKNQWFDGVEPNFGSSLPDFDIVSGDFGATLVPINEEIHQIAAVNAVTGQVTLMTNLGKNKLVAWQASALKIDPIEGLTIEGGEWRGGESGGASAWDHQYMWCRYMINSKVQNASFDVDPTMPLGQRRCGQAVRFDTGSGNTMDNLTIGAPQTVDAGEGYGVSFRLGERNSVIKNSYIEGCRHSIEYWASSGGNVCHDNHCHNDTSSSIDTHGNWNVDVTIRDNLVTRDLSAGASLDLDDDSPDAIRIGNNKFVFDENIKVLNNRVIGYDGNALSIVPGVQNVLVDGLEVFDVQRVLNLARNARHPDAITRNVTIRNVKADRWNDKMIFVWRETGTPIFENVLLENWDLAETLGADLADPHNTDGQIDGAYFSGIKNLTLRNFHIRNCATSAGKWAMELRNLEGVTFDNVDLDNGTRGVMFHGDCQDISGRIDIRNLDDGAEIEYLWWRKTGNTGAITIGTNQVIGTGTGQVRTQDDAPGDALVITNVTGIT